LVGAAASTACGFSRIGPGGQEVCPNHIVAAGSQFTVRLVAGRCAGGAAASTIATSAAPKDMAIASRGITFALHP
jgi:hypothetical protein